MGSERESRLRFVAFSGALAVGLGAFGAHGLASTLEANHTVETWETAVFYHFIHTLVLLWLTDRGRLYRGPVRCFGVGMTIFSGTLYVLSLTGIKWLGAITPIGGIALITGWVWLGWRASIKPV